jgi:esterase/lipase superfamily enzyme
MKLTMYYVTNRNHQGSKQFAPDGYGIHPSSSGIENLRLGKVMLDLRRSSLDKWFGSKTAAGNGDGVALSEYLTKQAKKHAKIVAYQEKIPDPERMEEDQKGKKLGSAAMFAEVQQILRQGRDVLIFVHGFNVSWWEAVGSVLALQAMVNRPRDPGQKSKDVLVVLFTWPSDGSALPFVAYRSDRTEAMGSGFALGRAFLKLRDFLAEATRPPTTLEKKSGKKWEPCLQNINVLCHSMGNYVLQHALQRVIEQSKTSRLPRVFDNVFLCSPDVDDNVLEADQPLGRLHEICRNISVYYNRGDLALRGSDITKGNPDRLGTNGIANTSQTHSEVSQIDCSEIVEGFMEHSYYLKGRINTDIRMSLDNVAQDAAERSRQHPTRIPNVYTMK